MDTTPTPTPTPTSTLDPRDLLPRDAYYHLIRTLRAALPPAEGTDEAIALRDRAAIAQAASPCPANAAEAAIAAQFVAANLQAMDCLRLAHDRDASREEAARCTAQAGSMMRQAQGAIRLLMRVQSARTKRDANEAAASQVAWVEHAAAGWMLEAVAESHVTKQCPTIDGFETNARRAEATPTAQPSGFEETESRDSGSSIENDSFETIPRPADPDAAPLDRPGVLSPSMGHRIAADPFETDSRSAVAVDSTPPSHPREASSHVSGSNLANEPFETIMRTPPRTGSGRADPPASSPDRRGRPRRLPVAGHDGWSLLDTRDPGGGIQGRTVPLMAPRP